QTATDRRKLTRKTNNENALVGARLASPFEMRATQVSPLPDPSQFAISERDRRQLRRRGGPADGVFDDSQDVGVVVGGEGFVAGTEVGDLAGAARPGAAGTEHFAA